jgi:hypothetical protein
MRRSRKFTAFAAILSLGVSGALTAQPASSSVQDMSPNSTLGWEVSETWPSGNSQAAITLPEEGYRDAAFCSEIGPGARSITVPSASCDPKNYSGEVLVQYNLMAPVCKGRERNCISQVSAVGPDGAKVLGEFLGYSMPSRLFIPENPTIGNPRGASSGIWKLPGVKNSVGTEMYEVQVKMNDGLASFKNGRLTNKFELQDRTFTAQIAPSASLDGGSEVSKGSLPPEYKFELSAILPRSVMSWYAGRVSGAEVKYQKIDATYNRITISGEPTTVPLFAPRISRSEATPELLEIFHFCQSSEPSCIGYYVQGRGNPRFVEAFRSVMNDKASGSRTVWAIRSQAPRFSESSNPNDFFACAPRDRAAGISTTNAMVFSGDIPKYKRGFFSYEVAGLHYEPDGATEFLGQYEMSMDEQMARCMFGFPRTPLSATVNVVNRDGTKAIATTIVGTKNGQMRLSAHNFTFSKKTIQVQLNAKGHVTCLRGDTVRFVKGTRCPGGFKKTK